jgi:DNA-binding SARP family transcriptional activator
VRRSSVRSLVRIGGVAVITGLVGLAGDTYAAATVIRESALDVISTTYVIPVVNPGDGVSLPSILLVQSAELTTVNPSGITTNTPAGIIYLSLQASSGPIQNHYGDANWGHFFLGMTPLPATAFSFIAHSGRRYPVTRANPRHQSNDPNGTSDDGLFDATYYFTIPIATRSGRVVISPSRTIGSEYTGFQGSSFTQLKTGGPTSISVSFPNELTVTTTPTATRATTALTASMGASFLNNMGLFVALVIGGYVTLKVRRRNRRRPQVAQPEVSRDANAWVPTPPAAASERPLTARSVGEPRKVGVLRVDVLGPLRITPSAKGGSDPLRAFIAYLALHDDRPQTADEIRTALWPETNTVTPVTQKTFLNYVSRARKFVGVNHLPEALNGAGYALRYATSDWREFRSLALAADQGSKEQGVELRRKALGLVRGVPLEGDTTSFFLWVASQKYTAGMIVDVCQVAEKLQSDLVMSGDLDGAEWAIRQALKLAATEMPLWRALVDICDARNDENVMSRFWAEAEHDLWPKAVDELRTRLVG